VKICKSKLLNQFINPSLYQLIDQLPTSKIPFYDHERFITSQSSIEISPSVTPSRSVMSSIEMSLPKNGKDDEPVTSARSSRLKQIELKKANDIAKMKGLWLEEKCKV